MEIETTLAGFKISLPSLQGKTDYYVFRRRDSANIELHSTFKSGGCVVNSYRKSKDAWLDIFFNYYKIEEDSLEYKAFEKLNSIQT